jgi:hypothetical protein
MSLYIAKVLQVSDISLLKYQHFLILIWSRDKITVFIGGVSFLLFPSFSPSPKCSAAAAAADHSRESRHTAYTV